MTSLIHLRDNGRLSKLPLALTLISPAADVSNTSVFARDGPVSSHIDKEEPAAAAGCPPLTAGAPAGSETPVASASAVIGDTSNSSGEHNKQQQQHPPHPHSRHHPHLSDSWPGGSSTLLKVLKGVAADAQQTLATQSSQKAAAAAVTSGWFDYIPGPSMVDEFHHYLRVRAAPPYV
jgi:hypothetical protein